MYQRLQSHSVSRLAVLGHSAAQATTANDAEGVRVSSTMTDARKVEMDEMPCQLDFGAAVDRAGATPPCSNSGDGEFRRNACGEFFALQSSKGDVFEILPRFSTPET